MSEVMKPENECPFDPKQYECHSVVAPVGSFSWALIQLKLRKLVSRSVWSDKKMYLAIAPRVNDLTVEEGSAYAADGVTVGTKYDYLTHIDLRNEHGNFVPWQPTQEDMMACDWEFVKETVKPEPEPKPEPESDSTLRLKGKITIGTDEIAEDPSWPSHTDKYFGYAQNVGKLNIGGWEEISNNTPIKNFVGFYTKHAGVYNFNPFSLNLSTDKESHEKAQQELVKKILKVRCLGKEYSMPNAELSSQNTLRYMAGNNYNLSDLASLFKKHVGETLEIEFVFVYKDPNGVYS